MPIDGYGSSTPPLGLADATPSRRGAASTLPMTARAGDSRRASAAGQRPPAGGGLGYSIRYFLAGKTQRAAMRAARSESCLAEAVRTFAVQWGRRRIDDVPAREGARLLRAVCNHALSCAADAREQDVGGIARRSLAQLKDPDGLSLLYNDLAARGADTRALAESQPAGLRQTAHAVLDTLEQALADTLAEWIGTPLFGRLLRIGGRDGSAAAQVRATLEQLQGVGLWLSSPRRPAAQVLARMLDILTDSELGQLTAQAWPELASQAEAGGIAPAGLDAAMAFLQACDGEALQLWRDALQRQLDDRERVTAGQATRAFGRVGNLQRLGECMRAAYRELNLQALTLSGFLPNPTLLQARIRAETLALVMQNLPESWRLAGLRALSAQDLSAIKSTLTRPAQGPSPHTAVDTTLEAAQADMLATHRRAVEGALADLHESIARRDRTVAATRLGALGVAVTELDVARRAFRMAMPADLAESLRHVVSCMRSLLPRESHARRDDALGLAEPADTPHALHRLSDAELGALRAARQPLAPFGMLVDKTALKQEIQARRGIPPAVHAAMDGLLDTLMDVDADAAAAHAGLRDVAGLLVGLNARRAAMGEDISAENNAELAAEAVRQALDRAMGHDPAPTQDRWAHLLARRDLTGQAMDAVVEGLAQWSARQPGDEAARLDACTSRVIMAWRVERYLYGAVHEAGLAPDAGPNRAHGDAADDGLDDARRAALAGQFGMDCDAAGRTVRPCMTRALHRLFEQHLAAPSVADAAQPRAVRLYAGDGAPTWFSVGERFRRDMLERPGMSLRVEGISAQGAGVRSAVFPASLDGAARLEAMGLALHALRELAGAALPAMTRWLHGGIAQAFAAALDATPGGYPLRLPDGSLATMPPIAPDTAHMRVRREADGRFSLETVLAWMEIGRLPLVPGQWTPRAFMARLDAGRSHVTARFVLAMDAGGAVTGLGETVDIRYMLVPLQ
ncbi:hypothetical protein [Bordetella bronchialis]|uniref:Uncharacterized protein n=1 Tax=Bordetella bronchialis TaxID=463025 RepID=A0A193FT07_9BORD|nr:hypothetical protein [Bordetella bronchialis]ANN70199.1 hypothetical protein BAU08_01510 [Bordetella bronchialis]